MLSVVSLVGVCVRLHVVRDVNVFSGNTCEHLLKCIKFVQRGGRAISGVQGALPRRLCGAAKGRGQCSGEINIGRQSRDKERSPSLDFAMQMAPLAMNGSEARKPRQDSWDAGGPRSARRRRASLRAWQSRRRSASLAGSLHKDRPMELLWPDGRVRIIVTAVYSSSETPLFGRTPGK